MIRDSTYVGIGLYGRRRYYTQDDGEKDVRRFKDMPKDSWITVKYPPLVDEQTWAKAQERRRHPFRQRTGKNKFDVQHMLRGLLWCIHCGRRYTAEATTRYKYYTRKKTGERVKSLVASPRRRYVCQIGPKLIGRFSL